MSKTSTNNLVQPRLLHRGEMKQKLLEIFETPLFFVISDMGSGKSTSIRDFLQRRRRIKYVWFSFDGEEIDDLWLWLRFSKLVEQSNAELGRRMIEYGLPYSPFDLERMVEIIKEAVDMETVVVLDDLHYCRSHKLIDTIFGMALAAIPQLHVVCISREFPEHNISELLSTGRARVMTKKDFYFTQTECENFFILNDARLTPVESDLLWKKTQGWVAGLYLALYHYLLYGSFTNMSSGNELVRTAVYSRFNDQTRYSLLMLSKLGHFGLDQAEVVTRDRGIRDVIVRMHDCYCLTKYSEETDEYSFHSILANLLTEEFENSGISENEVFERHGLWCLACNKQLEAIEAFTKYGDHERILKIMAGHNATKLMEEAPAIIVRAFDKIDLPTRLSNPAGYLTYIYSYSTNIDVLKGAELLQEAKQYYSDPEKSGDLPRRNHILGEIAMIESLKAFNNLEEMFACYKRANEYFDGGTSAIFSADVSITFGIPLNMFLYHDRAGGVEDMVRMVEEDFWIYNHIANGSGAGFDYLLRSELDFKRGLFDEAEMLAYKAIYKAKTREQCDILLSAYFVLLRIALFREKNREVNEFLLQMMQEVERNGSPVMLSCYEIILGYVFAYLGKFDVLPKWLTQEGGEKSKLMAISRNSACIMRGKILSETDRFEELSELADYMIPLYEKHHTIDGVMIFTVFKAIAVFHLENRSAGTKILREALEIAEKDGICVTIAENTYEVSTMLEEIGTPFARRIMEFNRQYVTAKQNYRNKNRRAKLSKREKEVMELVCDGLTAEAISKKLFISHSTVKKHIASSYQKLGVNKKAAAIAEFRRRKEQSSRRTGGGGPLDRIL